MTLRSKHVDLGVVDVCKPTLSATKAMKKKWNAFTKEFVRSLCTQFCASFGLNLLWFNQSERSNCDMRSKRDCCLGPHKIWCLCSKCSRFYWWFGSRRDAPSKLSQPVLFTSSRFGKKTTEIFPWHPTCPIERLTFRLMRRQQMFVCPRKNVDYPWLPHIFLLLLKPS